MSVVVSQAELFAEIDQWGVGFVASVNDDGSVRIVALRPVVVDDGDGPRLRFSGAGASTCRNLTARPTTTVAFAPHDTSNGFSLIVDGQALVSAPTIELHVTGAVRHRPAP